MSEDTNDTIITVVDESNVTEADFDTHEQACSMHYDSSVSSQDEGCDFEGNEDESVAFGPQLDSEDNEEQTTLLPETKGKQVWNDKKKFKGIHNQQKHYDNKGKGIYKGTDKKNNKENQKIVKNFNSKTGNKKNYQKNSNFNNNRNSNDNRISTNNMTDKNSGNNNNNNNNNNKNNSNQNNNRGNSNYTSSNINNNRGSNITTSSNNTNYNNNCKKDGGGEKHDINLLKQLKSIISICTREKEICQSPIDSQVLKLHYRMGVCILLLTFSMIQCNWFLRESIYCVFNYNAKETVSAEVKNICLSYPYICELPGTTTYGETDCPRQYVLFYRWIHLSFLLAACAYYIPRMFSKKAENPRLKKLIVDLAKEEQRYDGSTWERDTETMLNYMHSHISTHTTLYYWLVLSHVVALFIDVATIFFFDFILQGNFLRLVYLAYPFQRHPQNFTDELSLVFPPFVHCKLDGSVLINNARDDDMGCHLTLMELYEKVFIFLWIWLALITVCTAVSVLFLLLVTLPPFNRLFLCTHSCSKGIRNVKNKVLKLYGSADLYVFYLFKRHRSETQFIMFLTGLVHCAENKMLVGNDETNPSNLNEPANTDNGLDYPSKKKNEKFLNHTFPPDAHTSSDVSTPVKKNILTGFFTGGQIRSRKFHALLGSPEVQPPSDCIEVH